MLFWGSIDRFCSWSVAFGVSLGLVPAVQAQIVPDGTLGEEASVVVPGQDLDGQVVDLITGGSQQRSNLFHSFEQFNVGEGQTVYFDNPAGVMAIFSRVTGSSSSDILGKLGVDGGADLFLLNPNGFLFGPNAQLDIGGSFYATTAEKFVFPDGQEFSAVSPQRAPLLEVQAFDPQLWYGSLEATLRNEGQLAVGQNLLLGGHRLEMTAGASLQAEQDIVLQGRVRDLGNGDYTVGGYWFTETLAGETVDFVVPHSNVIWADGDITLLENYSGESLYVLAAGAVSTEANVDSIEITGGVIETTTQVLADGQTVTVQSDGDGYLDIRSAVDWDSWYGSNPGNLNSTVLGVSFDAAATGDIALIGVDLINHGGEVTLRSQVQPDSLLSSGHITVGGIDTSVTRLCCGAADNADNTAPGNAGGVSVTTVTGNVDIQKVDASYVMNYSLEPRLESSAGDIRVSTVTGNIDLNEVYASSDSYSDIQANGGHILISSINGDINVGDISSKVRKKIGAVSDAGDIFIATELGDINVASITTSGFSFPGGESLLGDTSLESGDIFLFSQLGSISALMLNSSIVIDPILGNFGNDVINFAQSGNTILKTELGNISVKNINSSVKAFRASVIGHVGDIFISTDIGHIDISDINTSVDSSDTYLGSAYQEDPTYYDAIQDNSASLIHITSNDGDINIGAIVSEWRSASLGQSLGSGSGGNLHITVGNGDIYVHDISLSRVSGFGNIRNRIGNGGDINITVDNGNVNLGNILSRSSSYHGGNTGALLQGGNGGNLSISAEGGNLQIGTVDLSSSLTSGGPSIGGNGGNILFSANNGHIKTSHINSLSFLKENDLIIRQRDREAGNGGNVQIFAKNDILTGNINVSSEGAFAELGGQGGNVTLSSDLGNITTASIYSQYIASGYASSRYGNRGYGGQGGSVTLNTINGDIKTTDIYTGLSAIEGQAGNINLFSVTGDITANALNASAGVLSIRGANRQNGIVHSSNAGEISVSTDVGDIEINSVDTSASSYTQTVEDELLIGGAGGDISIQANYGSIAIQDLASFSYSLSGYEYEGIVLNGGSVQGADGGRTYLSTTYGDIKVGGVNTTSISESTSVTQYGGGQFSGNVTGGSGGDIKISSVFGKIITQDLDSSSLAQSLSQISGTITGNNAGRIEINTTYGDIQTGTSIQATSFTDSTTAVAVAGAGNNITLSTQYGTLITPEQTTLETWATSQGGQASALGGSVYLSGSNQIDDYTILTQSSSEQAGTVTVQGFGNTLVDNVQILTTATVEASPERQIIIGVDEDGNPKIIDLPPILAQFGETAQSGNVNIQGTAEITLQNFLIQSNTANDRPAGNLTAYSVGLLTLQNNTQLVSNTQSSGQAGTFNLSSDTGILITGANTLLNVTTTDLGPAGNIILTAPTITLDQDATLQTSTSSPGNAGNIILEAGTFNLFNGAQIFSESSGAGTSGQITLNATEAINLGIGTQDQAPIISVETSNAGRAGDITLNTPRFTLSETARITATSTATSTNTEGGGSITLNANTMDLAGVVGIFAETQGQAPAGTLTLSSYQNSPNLTATFFDGSTISASTSGGGNGGDFKITAPNAIWLSGAGKLAVETTGSVSAGTFEITTPNLTLTDGINLTASTTSNGNAGSLTLNTKHFTLSNGALLQSNTTNDGNAGDITVNTTTLNLTNGGKILAETSGFGTGGTITVNATDHISLGEGGQEAAPVISVETSGPGAAGNIILNAPRFSLAETAQITATATATATTQEGGGSISLNANTMELAGVVGIFAETQGQSPAGTLALQPYQSNSSLTMTLTPSATISASTSGSGNGGDLQITAPQEIDLAGAGKIAVETTSTGNAGNLSITAPTLNLRDGLEITASTYGSGKAGNIDLTATNLTLSNGVLVRTNTFSSGNAGNIKVTARDRILSDNSRIEARTEPGSTGNGGDINIDPITTILQNNAQVAVNSQGTGRGGDIFLVSDNLTLSDFGRITAETLSTDGGNIFLTVPQLLQMQRDAVISTEAGTALAGGNGGNINITAGFLIGSDNSDIITNAYAGNGGVVTINALGVLNFVIENSADPRGDLRNNITANSVRANAGTLDVEAGTTTSPDLPTVPQVSDRVDQSCDLTGPSNQGKFTVTGRGGIAVSAHAPASLPSTTLDLRLQPDLPTSTASFTQAAQPNTTQPTAPRFFALTSIGPCTR